MDYKEFINSVLGFYHNNIHHSIRELKNYNGRLCIQRFADDKKEHKFIVFRIEDKKTQIKILDNVDDCPYCFVKMSFVNEQYQCLKCGLLVAKSTIKKEE